MIEFNILKLFIEDVSLYDKYHATLKLDFIRESYPVLNKLFKCLPASSFADLEGKYLSQYPVIKDGDREALRNVISQSEMTETSAESIVTYLESHLARAWANDLSLMALDVAQGSKPASYLDEIIAKRESTVIELLDDVDYVSTDIEDLLQEDALTPGLTWRLKCLNQSLGPLRKGNFGHIFARVETGKTAMWVSEATFMAEQVDKPILILFNEEGGRDIVYRMYNAVTGMTFLEISTNPKAAKKIWDAKIGDKIKFVDNPAQIERRKIEKLVETLDPSLIVCDNMDKVKGFTGDRKDLVLHEIYKWGREIAKVQCPFITVGQADNTGHNSKILDESQMADSKTAKPSELDFIIGIGRIDKDGYENQRYISIPKNKLRGDTNSVESMRHMKAFEVTLAPQFSIYKDY